jgi:hypothetical protein
VCVVRPLLRDAVTAASAPPPAPEGVRASDAPRELLPPVGGATPVLDLGWRESVRRMFGAVDVAVRRPKRWFAGFCYEFLALGWAIGVLSAVPLLSRALPSTSKFGYGFEVLSAGGAFDLLRSERWPVFTVLLLLLALRLAPGLARSFFLGGGTEANERSYHAGRGLGVSTGALWLEVVLTMFAVGGLTVGLLVGTLGLVGADAAGPLPKVGAGLVSAFLLLYGATLGALFHLALASLVRHRRDPRGRRHVARAVRPRPRCLGAVARGVLVAHLPRPRRCRAGPGQQPRANQLTPRPVALSSTFPGWRREGERRRGHRKSRWGAPGAPHLDW